MYFTEADDPRTPEPRPKFIQPDMVPIIAKRQLNSTPSPAAVAALFQSVVANGMTSEQEIAKAIGKDVLEVLRSKKSNPSPAKCQLVLQFFAALDPEAASYKKERWRHANPRPKEEQPEPQAL